MRLQVKTLRSGPAESGLAEGSAAAAAEMTFAGDGGDGGDEGGDEGGFGGGGGGYCGEESSGFGERSTLGSWVPVTSYAMQYGMHYGMHYVMHVPRLARGCR